MAEASAGWRARLALQARRDGDRTVVHSEHEGPLRVLKALYPEQPQVCHHAIVHPPAGIVGGDRLQLDITLDVGSHLLLTTPGATRFYRSEGPLAEQQVQARLAARARLEWLPLETLVYSGAQARNIQRFTLDEDAEMIGWDLLALGLPAAELPFAQGRFEQQIKLPGLWLERGVIDALDARLLDSPLGLAGHSVLGTLWWACGPEADEAHAVVALDVAREVLQQHELTAAATTLAGRVVILRVLAARTEPAMRLLRDVRLAWREALWALPRLEPRLWAT